MRPAPDTRELIRDLTTLIDTMLSPKHSATETGMAMYRREHLKSSGGGLSTHIAQIEEPDVRDPSRQSAIRSFLRRYDRLAIQSCRRLTTSHVDRGLRAGMIEASGHPMSTASHLSAGQAVRLGFRVARQAPAWQD